MGKRIIEKGFNNLINNCQNHIFYLFIYLLGYNRNIFMFNSMKLEMVLSTIKKLCCFDTCKRKLSPHATTL